MLSQFTATLGSQGRSVTGNRSDTTNGSWRAISSASALGLTLCLMTANPAQAADSTWVGGTSGTWSSNDNWSNNMPGGINFVNDDTTDRASFTNASVLNTTINLDQNNIKVGKVLFNSDLDYTFNNYQLDTTRNSDPFVNLGAGNITFNSQFRPRNTAPIFTNNGTGLVSFLSAPVGSPTIGGIMKQAVAGNMTFTGSGDFVVSTFSKRRGDYTTTSVIKEGAGTLTISGFQTIFAVTGSDISGLTDDTIINSGTIRITSGDQRSLGQPQSASATWLTLNGGALQVSTNDLAINNANAGVRLNASGGTFNVDTSRALTIGGGGGSNLISGTGALTKTGTGTLTLSAANTYTGTTNVTAGTLQIGNGGTTGSLSASSSITNNATLAFNRSNTVTQGTDFASVISGTGGVTQAGSGTLVLSGTNTYTGTTTVSQGTLALGASGSIAASSSIIVGSGATLDVSEATTTWTVGTTQSLSGTGTLAGNVIIAGNLNPGNSPGVITFEDDLTLNASSATTMEFIGSIRGAEYDGVDIGGNLVYGGALILDFQSLFTEGNYTFNLFDVVGTRSGDFSSVALDGVYGDVGFTFNSGDWSASTNINGGETWLFSQSTGNLSLTVIPEPASALLGGLGCLLLLRRRRN